MRDRASLPLFVFGATALTVLLLVPVGVLLVQGLSQIASSNIFSDANFWRVVGFTYGQALLSTLLSAIAGIPLALVYVDWSVSGKSLLWSLSQLCYCLPAIVVVGVLIAMWGGSGLVARMLGVGSLSYGLKGILLAHVFLNFPIFFKNTALALKGMGRDEELGAISLGMSRFQVFLVVTIPKLYPVIVKTGFLVFLLCSSSFLIPLLLGGGPRFSTIDVIIFQAVKVQYDLAVASRLAVFQLLIGTGGLILLQRISVPQLQHSTWVPLYFFRSERLRQLGVLLLWLVFGVFVIGPLISYLGSGFSRANFIVLAALMEPMLWSLRLATVAALLALTISMGLALGGYRLGGIKNQIIEIFASGPLFVSSTILSLSWMLTYRESLFHHRGNLTLIAMAQAMGVLPLTFRIVSDALNRIPKDLIRSAHSIGCSPFQVFQTIELPLIRRSVVYAFVLAMGYSLGEVGCLLMLSDGRQVTLPLALYRLMATYRFHEAELAGGVLIVVLAGVFFLMERFEKWR